MIKVTTLLLFAGALVLTAGCASIQHPERVNQPQDQRGDLDIIPLGLDLVVPGGSLLAVYDIMDGAAFKPKSESKPKPTPAPAASKAPTPVAAPTPPPAPNETSDSLTYPQ